MQVKDLVVTGNVRIIGELYAAALADKAPMYQYSTTDIGTGAPLPTGVVYFVYE